MQRGPASAASARAPMDQSPHTGSSVRMSSRTLLSTSVPVAMSGAAGQGHDLIGRHRHIAASCESFGELAPTGGAAVALADDDGVLAAFELDLGPGSDPERVSEFLGDGDLTLLGDLHGRNLTRCTPTEARFGLVVGNLRGRSSALFRAVARLTHRVGHGGVTFADRSVALHGAVCG